MVRAEPWRTLRELFERLQAEYPGVYPDGQPRTCQRRLKEWRREAALQLVFGTAPVDVDSKNECPAVAYVAGNCPVDLPLRLDDAGASPTTPQVSQQQASSFYEGRGFRNFNAGEHEATGASQ
jgi:hypothetical protein